jgi:hypothetical protein
MLFPDLKDMSPLDRALEIISFLTMAANIILAALFYSGLPGSIPVHFTIAGVADDWGDRAAFLAFPVFSLLFYFLFTYLVNLPEKFSFPFEHGLEEKRVITIGMLRWVKLEVLLLISYIEYIIIKHPDGKAGFLYGLPAFAIALVLTMAFYLYKGYRIRQDENRP